MHSLNPEDMNANALKAFYYYGVTVAKVTMALKDVHFTSLGNSWPDEKSKEIRTRLSGVGTLGEPK
jgi:hypothetical protein